VENLITEISGAPEHHILISSEDFECAGHQGPRFSALIQRLQSTRRDVAVLVYLRDQIDYTVSLYMEMLKHGLDTFAEFLEKILTNGRYDLQSGVSP
jgi:hypothetical protein